MSTAHATLTTESPTYWRRVSRCRGQGCGVEIVEHLPRDRRRTPPERTLCADCLAESFRAKDPKIR